MSDGYVHGRDTILVGSALTLASVLAEQLYYLPHTATGVALGAFLGVVFTPDSDLSILTWGETVLKRVPILGWYIATRTLGYALLFPVHRGVSHVYIVGTLTRFLYSALIIGWDICAICFLFHLPFPNLVDRNQLICLFCTWCIQDSVHIWRDRHGKY